MSLSKNHQGFAAAEAVLVVLVLGLIGFAGWYVQHHRRTATTKTPALQSSTSTPKNTVSASKQLTYTSAAEKASITYPTKWSRVKPPTQTYGLEAFALRSPDGKVTISWVDGINGIGGDCDTDIPAGTSKADGSEGCMESTVVSATPIAGASGLYVVSGYETNDNKTFYPWIAVQPKDGTESDRALGYETYFSHTNQGRAFLAIGGLGKGAPAPSFTTSDNAKAFLQTGDAQQAVQILGSLKY